MVDIKKYTAQDPNYAKRVRDSFDRQQFMHYINASLKDIQAGYCEISLPHTDDLTQQHGFFHAGVVSTLADNSAGYAAYSLMAATSTVLTVEFKINLVAPAKGETLTGKANVIKHGKTLTICQSEVYADDTLCAVAQVTLMELREKSDNKQKSDS